MIRRRDHPRGPGQASRESPLGRVKRNRTIRASRAIYRRLYPPIAYDLMNTKLIPTTRSIFSIVTDTRKYERTTFLIDVYNPENRQEWGKEASAAGKGVSS